MRLFCLFSLLAAGVILVQCSSEFFDEELILIPHGDSIVAQFNFAIELATPKAALEGVRDFELLAKQIAAAVADHDVLELHLSLTRGEWRESLGYPIVSSPTGAELWAWFGNESDASSDEKWKRLLHVLSAMYCTSLQELMNEATSSNLAFKPTGVVPHDIAKQPLKYLRYGAIARETLCTENLAPSKNLLPCAGKAGIGSLLNPTRLFDTEFNALQLHVRHVAKPIGSAEDGAPRKMVVEVRQTFTTVFPLFDSERLPDSASFSLKSLFDKMVIDRCNAARRSTILVDVTHFRNNATASDVLLDGAEFTPSPSFVRSLQFGLGNNPEAQRSFAGFELHGDAFVPTRDPYFNLKTTLRFSKRPEAIAKRFFAKRAVPLSTHRFLTGVGQYRNGVKTYLRNNLRNELLTVTYFETLPWFARLSFNTLKIQVQRASDNDSAPFEPYTADNIHLLPGVDRQRPHRFELLIRVPARSAVSVAYEFEKAALRWFEYPPDPNHGFYLPASSVSFNVPTSTIGLNSAFAINRQIDAHFYNQVSFNHSTLSNHLYSATDSEPASVTTRTVFQRIHTHILNFGVATPDFSMPFNVICLTSTVIAIAFGSLHNLTTRSFVLADSSKRKSLIDRIFSLPVNLLRSIGLVRASRDTNAGADELSADKRKTE